MPVNNAITAINAKKPKIIPIATMVSVNSTEWVRFMIYILKIKNQKAIFERYSDNEFY